MDRNGEASVSGVLDVNAAPVGLNNSVGMEELFCRHLGLWCIVRRRLSVCHCSADRKAHECRCGVTLCCAVALGSRSAAEVDGPCLQDKVGGLVTSRDALSCKIDEDVCEVVDVYV